VLCLENSESVPYSAGKYFVKLTARLAPDLAEIKYGNNQVLRSLAALGNEARAAVRISSALKLLMRATSAVV
jgi:hypothetical protein